ncbi:HI1506-related protein [Edwardsiella tarda]|uniref:HI1506-related protein n=1 Tax=Edwardsiella tarda TaxID=636 RepID=UPI00351C4475
MIYITSKRNGFYRCGVAHSEHTTAWADDHFSPEQLAMLEAEPMLIVTRDNPQAQSQQAAEQQIAALKAALVDAQQRNDALSTARDEAEHRASALSVELEAANARIAELTAITPTPEPVTDKAKGNTKDKAVKPTGE